MKHIPKMRCWNVCLYAKGKLIGKATVQAPTKLLARLNMTQEVLASRNLFDVFRCSDRITYTPKRSA